MLRTTWIKAGITLAIGMLCLAVAVSTSAQVQTETHVKSGTPTKEVTIESGEVVAVKGNDLFVKMADGTMEDFRVPAGAKVKVDGQMVAVQDLKPGTKLQRATVVTTTLQVVMTIESVEGKVWHVNPPVSVILTLANGENQMFKIPDGQKFIVGGQEVDAWHLKKGMLVSAVRVTEAPATSVTKQTHVAGTIAADQPVLIAQGSPKPAPAAAGTTTAGGTTTAAETTTNAEKKLPKTASDLPLIGIFGLVAISASLISRWLRKRQA